MCQRVEAAHRVLGAGGLEDALHQGESVHVPGGAGKAVVPLQPVRHLFRSRLPHAGDGEVRDEWPEFEGEPGGEQAVVDLLPELVQTRVKPLEARPHNRGSAARRKPTDTADVHPERLDANPGQHGFGAFDEGLAPFTEEAHGQMRLLRRNPAEAGALLTELAERPSGGIGGNQGDEQAHGRERLKD